MAVVADGVNRGTLRDDIPLKLIRDMIFGAIEHQTWAYLRGEGDFSVEDSAAGMTDVVYRGIAKSAATAQSHLGETVTRLEKIAQTLDARLKPLRL